MGQERRAFGSIERRSGYFRARYVGPDRQRYDAPHLFSERIDAEFWLGEVHRSISRQEWRPPVKVKGRPDDLDTLAGYARHCLAERELTPRTREEYGRLLEKLIAPTLGMIQLKHLEPDRIRRWYSTVLSADRPVQRKHAYSLLRSILREAEDEGLIDRNPCRVRNAGKGAPHARHRAGHARRTQQAAGPAAEAGPAGGARGLVRTEVGGGARSAAS